MKKPAVILFLQICLALIALSYSLDALGSLFGLLKGLFSLSQGLGGFLVGSAVGATAILLLVKSSRQSISRRAVVLFIWAVFFAYPLSRVLAAAGLFPPPPDIPANQLAGAAAYEFIRYVSLLGLIVWLSFSKSAATYLPLALTNRSRPTPQAAPEPRP